MNRIILTATALSLASCGGAASNKAAPANGAAVEANVAEAPVVNMPAPAAATPSSVGLTADFMAGKWSAIGEDCKDTVEFKKDGTVMTPIGPGKWTLVGDQLSFDYGDGSKQPSSTIKVLAPDRIEITRGGHTETQKRC